MPTEKRFLDQNGLILLLQEIESLDETNIKDLYWSTDNADTNPTVVFKVGDDSGNPHSIKKLTFTGETGTVPTGATPRTLTITIGGVNKTITYYDTDNSTGLLYSYTSDSTDPKTATTVKAALDRAITAIVNLDPADEKVKLTALTGTTALPILTTVIGTPTSGANAGAGYDTDFKFTPSSNTLIVKAATASASGVTITPSSIKVGTTATNGAAELTPSQLKVGSGTLTATEYSGKATQTETDLAVHSGTNDGATKVGYSSSETGYTEVTTVDGALDQIITDLAKKEDKTFIIDALGNLDSSTITISNPSKTYTEIREASSERTVVVRLILRNPIVGRNRTVFVPLVFFSNDTLSFGAFLEDKTFVYLTCNSSDQWDGYFLHDYGFTDGDNITFTPQADDATIISAIDEKVNLTATTANSDIPMLLANGATPSNGGALYDADLKYNPSTNTLKLGTGTLTATNYSGTSAKATADGSGNNIVNTYATKAALEALTNQLTSSFLIVTTLPTADGSHGGIIYLIKDQEYGDVNNNIFKEYVEVNDGTTASPSWKFELLGTTDAGVDVVTIPATGTNSVASMFAQYVTNA